MAIIRNLTAVAIELDDLDGITVPALGDYDLLDTPDNDLRASVDLPTAINVGDIVFLDATGNPESTTASQQLLSQVDNVSSAIQLRSDAVDVPNTPHSIINFNAMVVVDNNDGSVNVANVYGSNFQKVEDYTVSTTLSTSFTTKLTMNTPTLPVGTYRIGLNYGWNHNSTSSDFESKLLEDGIQKGEIHKQEPKDSSGSFGSTGTSQRFFTQRVFYSTYSTTATHSFDFLFRTDDNDDESSIFETVIEIWRVS